MGTILYNTLNYAIVSRHQINTCTVLKEKVERGKLENLLTKNKQRTSVSKTEVHSIPLWILSGYTRELANFIILTHFNNLLTIFTLKFRLMCSVFPCMFKADIFKNIF